MTTQQSASALNLAQQCLQQYQALQQEMDTAMSAIARNALSEFEHSLWQQEMLSTGLRRTLFLVTCASIDPVTRSQLQIAGAALQQKSQSYKALVEQSAQAAALLQGVCSLYQTAPWPGRTTSPIVSCEA